MKMLFGLFVLVSSYAMASPNDIREIIHEKGVLTCSKVYEEGAAFGFLSVSFKYKSNDPRSKDYNTVVITESEMSYPMSVRFPRQVDYDKADAGFVASSFEISATRTPQRADMYYLKYRLKGKTKNNQDIDFYAADEKDATGEKAFFGTFGKFTGYDQESTLRCRMTDLSKQR